VDQKLDNVFSLLLEDADGMNLVGGKEKRVCSKIKHKNLYRRSKHFNNSFTDSIC
jgi:hypothetical protein